ncbi:uncharacterized protein LOC119986911 [Tripterygium wilfordii]|uniref:uncharacterized protein LOC119986911 n=1 Tax=Tripterygium wilfordii TaxID=458696 RepID=UPI0018F82FDF|nr:uncharacterized protein LOC119986911 [Tripterygium wilfordii]
MALLPGSKLYGKLTRYPCKSFQEVQARASIQIKWEEDEGRLPERLTEQPKKSEQKQQKPPPPEKTINVIFGGSEISGITHSSAKKHVKQTENYEVWNDKLMVQFTRQVISFTDDEMTKLLNPHDDALVITLQIVNCEVKRVMIGDGSSVNLLFMSTLQAMGLSEVDIIRGPIPLIGFNGEQQFTISSIPLQVYAKGINLQQGPILSNQKEPANKEIEEIIIHPDYPDQKIQIEANLDHQLRENLNQFLQNHKHTFAWTHADMIGIDPNIITHQLQVDDNFLPLANVVVVKKKNGKWRVCIDFTDLNNACPKDSFPLPHIDILVDATTGHELLRFMDAFSGYNQILMHPNDQEKTAFITERGIYCYKVMPFGLKNAGATYQWLVNRMFASLLRKTMEVYIDDMLVKTLKAEDHIEHLRQAFEILDAHQMKLNPLKCVFRVKAGKFLGFIVTQRSMEANPDQIQAILDIRSPTTI